MSICVQPFPEIISFRVIPVQTKLENEYQNIIKLAASGSRL
jgi:hypothetical protein